MVTRRPALGAAMLIAATFLFGLNGSTAKTIMQSGVTAAQITLFRSLSTTIIAGIVLLVTNRKAFRVAKGEWKWLVILGMAGVGLMQWSYANAVANLPVGVALLIQYTAVVIVPVASIWLFRERLSTRLWLGVALVLAGLVAVSHIWEGGLSFIGIIFGATAAIATAIYYMVGEHLNTNRPAMSTLFYTMLFSSLMWFALTPWWDFDFGRFTTQLDLGGNLAGIHVAGWFAFAWLGIMGSFMPLFFTYAALSHLSATSVGVFSTTETVFGFLFAYLWLGEKIDGLQTVGGLLVIAGIVIAQISRRKSAWQPSN
jgi:drug/metabolite transporter (DMT)-like permease